MSMERPQPSANLPLQKFSNELKRSPSVLEHIAKLKHAHRKEEAFGELIRPASILVGAINCYDADIDDQLATSAFEMGGILAMRMLDIQDRMKVLRKRKLELIKPTSELAIDELTARRYYAQDILFYGQKGYETDAAHERALNVIENQLVPESHQVYLHAGFGYLFSVVSEYEEAGKKLHIERKGPRITPMRVRFVRLQGQGYWDKVIEQCNTWYEDQQT